MRKIFTLLLVFVSLFCVSCKKKKDLVLRENVVSLQASYWCGASFNAMSLPDWESMELVASSDGNALNFFVSRVPISVFMGHEAEEYDDLLTEEVITKYKIKGSEKNNSKDYYFHVNRKKKDSLAALDVFVLCLEDTSLGILSKSSSNVAYKIVAHK